MAYSDVFAAKTADDTVECCVAFLLVFPETGHGASDIRAFVRFGVSVQKAR